MFWIIDEIPNEVDQYKTFKILIFEKFWNIFATNFITKVKILIKHTRRSQLWNIVW